MPLAVSQCSQTCLESIPIDLSQSILIPELFFSLLNPVGFNRELVSRALCFRQVSRCASCLFAGLLPAPITGSGVGGSCACLRMFMIDSFQTTGVIFRHDAVAQRAMYVVLVCWCILGTSVLRGVGSFERKVGAVTYTMLKGLSNILTWQ